MCLCVFHSLGSTRCPGVYKNACFSEVLCLCHNMHIYFFHNFEIRVRAQVYINNFCVCVCVCETVVNVRIANVFVGVHVFSQIGVFLCCSAFVVQCNRTTV